MIGWIYFSGFLSIYRDRLGNKVELLDLKWMRVIDIVLFKYLNLNDEGL